MIDQPNANDLTGFHHTLRENYAFATRRRNAARVDMEHDDVSGAVAESFL